ncbi:LuxR family transcriptional regulator [Streptomyces sp. NPDC091267]|uniref:helix-turn-helix transcriptional regulator n=1 Tax=Streptomyces sp. NPDC091267 TaxID=3155195 RepID=UPI00342F7679
MRDVEAAAGAGAEFSSWQGAVQEVVRALRCEGRVAVTGVWGSGKSTLLAEALGEACGEGVIVVRVTCADEDRAHVFGGVAQLLSAVPPGLLADLPAGWRSVADRLLRRSLGEPAVVEEITAARLAVAGLLRAWPGVVLAVDGAQWLDEASAEVLGYAVRTVAAPHLSVVVSERVEGRPAAAALLLGGHPAHVPVPALDVARTAAVAAAKGLPQRWATAVYQSCGGHRLLTGITCTALARQRPGERYAYVVPAATVQASKAWLATLPTPVRATLLIAASAVAPTLFLLERAGRRDAEDHVRLAVAAGVLHHDRSGSLRFTARVVADALISGAGRRERTSAHRALAGAVADPVQQVRHRALGCEEATDQCLAEDTAEAAGRAHEDGDRALAAELFLLAAELTPVSRPRLRLERFLSGAREAAAAGDSRRAWQAADAVAASRPTPAEHVTALLAVVDAHSQALAGVAGLLGRCRQIASNDPELLAAVELRAAITANVSHSSPDEALSAAKHAADLARNAGQPRLEAAALTMRARMERVLSHEDSARSLSRALALNVPVHEDGIGNSAQYLAARHAVFDDRLAEARARLTTLLAVAEQHGQQEDLVDIWRSLAEVEVRSGACAQALVWAGTALEASVAAGLSLGPACYTAALAQSAGGSFGAALRYAACGESAAREEGDVLHLARNLWVAGTVRLHTGEIDEAVALFTRLDRSESGRPSGDPSMFRWQPDAIEAFVAGGMLDAAHDLVLRRDGATREDTATGAGWTRARALLLARAGDTDQAVLLLRQAAAVFRGAGLPIEEARTCLVLGRTERARRRQAAARAAFRTAAHVLTNAGALPLLATAEELLNRLDGHPQPQTVPGRAELTGSERRLAGLVSQGASNQHAAQQMYISVKTVESMLSRIYRKLRIRSRTQLAAALTTTVS